MALEKVRKEQADLESRHHRLSHHRHRRQFPKAKVGDLFLCLLTHNILTER